MTRMLEAERFECRAAADYRGALRTASEWLPDFLVCDIDLQSNRDGIDVLRAMRSAHQTIQGISVSGLSIAEAEARSQSGGFEAHLAKPVNFDHLIAALRSLMLSPKKVDRRSRPTL